MEFDEKLTAFQGVIFAADSTYPFSTLISKGGNETKISYVVNSIREYLQKENYLVENMNMESIKILRKFAFYIVINADLEILKKLVEYESLDFVIWTLPTIPTYLMCEILWQLNMDIFLYEIIVLSCPKLAIEVAAAAIKHYRNLEPNSLDKLKFLTIACYRQLYRMAFIKVKLSTVLKSLRNFENCLKYFKDPPKKETLNSLSDDDKFKFMGKQFYSLLYVTKSNLLVYSSTVKFRVSDYQDLYQLTFGEDEVINNGSHDVSTSENKTVVEILDRANLILLDICRYLAIHIDVNVFCSWSEFEFDNTTNIQNVIGSLSYKIVGLLQKIEKLANHPVVNFLKEISTKPINYCKMINIISTKDILLKLKNEDDKEELIKALLSRNNLCEDKALIEEIDTHLELLNEDECAILFRILSKYLKFNASTELDHLKLLAIKTFRHCSFQSKSEMVANYFSSTVFVNSLETSEFRSMLTEVFNKFVNTKAVDFASICTLFIQNPRKVFVKVFCVATEGIEQGNVMVSVLKELEAYFTHYYEEDTIPCLLQVIKHLTKHIENRSVLKNFAVFLNSLKTAGTFTGTKLLLLVIMPNLYTALQNKNVFHIFVSCTLIRECFPIPELGEYRQPMLAMFAQVLDTLRWKITTYDAIAPFTLETVIHLQRQIMKLYGSEIPATDRIWLKRKIKNIDPLNMFYYKLLWQPPGNTFAEVISGIRIHKDMNRQDLTIWLSKVLCSTILIEWIFIWRSLMFFGTDKLLTLYNDALLILIMTEKFISTQNSKRCILDHCIYNFVKLIRFTYLPDGEEITDKQVENVFTKIILIENVMEDTDVDPFCLYTLPLISYIAEKKPDINIDILKMAEEKLKHKVVFCLFYDLFMRKKQSG